MNYQLRKCGFHERMKGLKAVERMSVKARTYFTATTPLTLYEYENHGNTLYSVRGCVNFDGYTFQQIEKYFERQLEKENERNEENDN